jgi:hypothetical protein
MWGKRGMFLPPAARTVRFPNSGRRAGTDLEGLCPFHADAVRTAGHRVGIIPQEVQAIRWEAIRKMTPDTWKRIEMNSDAVDARRCPTSTSRRTRCPTSTSRRTRCRHSSAMATPRAGAKAVAGGINAESALE